MTRTTRSLARAGIGAGLALALVVPLGRYGERRAPSRPAASAKAAAVSASSRHEARRRAARGDRAPPTAPTPVPWLRPRAAFYAQPRTSSSPRPSASRSWDRAPTPPSSRRRTRPTRTSVSDAAETRAAAIDAARTARFAAVDAAWATYDLAVNPAHRLGAQRLPRRNAQRQLRAAAPTCSRRTRRSAPRPRRPTPHSALRSTPRSRPSQASGRTPADVAAFGAAVDRGPHRLRDGPGRDSGPRSAAHRPCAAPGSPTPPTCARRARVPQGHRAVAAPHPDRAAQVLSRRAEPARDPLHDPGPVRPRRTGPGRAHPGSRLSAR